MSGTNSKSDIAVVGTDGDGDSLRQPLLDVQPMAVSVPADHDLESSLLAQPPEVGNAEGEDSNAIDAIIIDESDWDHGEAQPQGCRDCFWGFLFLVQFAVVLTISVMGIRNIFEHSSEWYPSEDQDDDDDNGHDNGYARHTLYFSFAILGTAIALPSILLNLLLGAFSSMLIQISLVFSPFSFFVAFIVSLLTMNCPVALFSLLMSLISAFYALKVWHRVPLATANLKIALAAIKDNHGLWIIAYLVTVESWAWIFLWCSAVVEMVVFSPKWVYDCSSVAIADHDGNQDVCTLSTRGKFIALGMLLSFFWTDQVIKNIFRTTISGVVGTWWFDPVEARSSMSSGRSSGLFGCCGCSTAIYDSWFRSGFYSFGSIAFGSLLVGLLKSLRWLVRCGRQKRDQQRRNRGIEGTDILFCLLQFVVDKLEYFVEYINAFAFVYVGLYGYDYLTAGKQVSGLFKARGWEVIINDDLVARSLGLMSIFISFVTGIVALLLGFFLIGPLGSIQFFFLGLLLAHSSFSVLFGVVTSAVNTVVVCFAESPNQLRENGHNPEHFRELAGAYRTAYPNDCGF